MKICGLNNASQLDKNSNNTSSDGISIISPPITFHVDHSLINSISTYSDHTVWITKDGKSYSIGDNKQYQISGLLSKKVLREDTEIIFKTNEGQPYKFISVVCGHWYTLYLVSDESNISDFQLILCYKYKTPNPLFLNIDNRIPRFLFGGEKNSAVIDTEGGIIIITESVFNSPLEKIETKFLPFNEKAVKLACCSQFIISLSQSGRIYECQITKNGPSEFSEISEFSDKTVIDVSGTCEHCFIVLDDGSVFGRGSNWCCKLGLPPGTKPVSFFTKIESLKEHKIVSAFAGTDNSIFKTIENKMIVCGYNFQGQLFISPQETVYPPEKVDDIENFTFCISSSSSIAFVDIDPPRNISNKKIEFVQNEFCEIERLQKKLDLKEDEILKLKLELKKSEIRIKELEEENARLKKKVEGNE